MSEMENHCGPRLQHWTCDMVDDISSDIFSTSIFHPTRAELVTLTFMVVENLLEG